MLRPGGLDLALVRDALRDVRHIMRTASSTLHSLPPPPIPEPANTLARRAVEELGQLADTLDRKASVLARHLLGSAETSGGALTAELPMVDGTRFSSLLYWAMKAFEERFGSEEHVVSEVLARDVFERTRSDENTDPADLAAELILGLLAAGAVRKGSTKDKLEHSVPVAVFSSVLWMLTEREHDDPMQVLLAAQDLAIAAYSDVVRAARSADRSLLSSLLKELERHV